MKTLVIVLALSAVAFYVNAQGPGRQKTNIKNHPRVNQVNKREDKQEVRIHHAEKEGKISQQQGNQDLQNVKAINQEKRTMRKNDEGHLTKADQQALDQQLNQNSQDIEQQKKKNRE